MADIDDDHQSDLGGAYGDDREAPAPSRRFSRPRGDRGEPDGGATGEARRPSSSGGRRGRARGGRRGGGRGGGGGGGARRGGAAGGGGLMQNPRARLGLVALFAVILIIVIALVVRDCQRSQLEDSYTGYMNSVAQIVQASADQGRELREVLSNTEGLAPPELRARIQEITTQAEGLVAQAEELSPPEALSQSQSSLVTLLRYRVTGLTNLGTNLPSLLQADEEDFTANGIADQMQRFLASDVIYEDSFVRPAEAAMESDDISGIEIPGLQPFLANDVLATMEGAKTLLPGLRRTASTGDGEGEEAGGEGNLRGNALMQTVAQPSDTRLSTSEVTTVEASENLEWNVIVTNQGDFVESDVIVTATFSYPSSPDAGEVREASIPVIEPGQEISVTLPGPSDVDYREQGALRIEIAPVQGEAVLDNNRAEYPIRIAL